MCKVVDLVCVCVVYVVEIFECEIFVVGECL